MNKVILAEKQFLAPLKEFEKKQNKLVKDNPFVKITDNTSFEAGKKSRTSLLKGRTELQNQQKTINKSVNSIKDAVKEETERLIAITSPAEEKQQIEVKAYESIQETARVERERIKQEKEDEIKGMIDEICDGFSGEIKTIEFNEIEAFTVDFNNSLERIDTSSFEDLEMYFSGKVAVLKNELSSKTSELEKDQELLIAKSESRFQAFKSHWMERFMLANRTNIHQLNIDFDTEVPSIDADSFFSFKDDFIQQSGKFRDQLVDLTNKFKLEQEKQDEFQLIQETKERIDAWFKEGTRAIDKMTFDTIPAVADNLARSFDDIRSRKEHKAYKDLIEMRMSILERLHKDNSEILAGLKIEFDKEEKERLLNEKNALKVKTAGEKKRQNMLKPQKKHATEIVMKMKSPIFGVYESEELNDIVNGFTEDFDLLVEKVNNQINNL